MAIVIDDHLLIDVVAETTTGWLREQVDQSVIYTTSAWYYRVANAAHRGSGTGTLSRRRSAEHQAWAWRLLVRGRAHRWIPPSQLPSFVFRTPPRPATVVANTNTLEQTIAARQPRGANKTNPTG